MKSRRRLFKSDLLRDFIRMGSNAFLKKECVLPSLFSGSLSGIS